MTVTMFITKYALTYGLMERTGLITEDGKYFAVKGGIGSLFCRVGRGCFHTREEAEAAACEDAKRKIKSLQRQIKKLLPLTKSPKWGTSERM